MGGAGWRRFAAVAALLLVACQPASESEEGHDKKFLWLEGSYAPDAIAWAEEETANTLEDLGEDPRFALYRDEAEAILTDDTRIPYARFQGGFAYNYWQDRSHPLGLWRRAPMDGYLAGSPDWQTLIDLDDLSETEGRRWIFRGADCTGEPPKRCLVTMADNGKDATVTREFDLDSRAFVIEGFKLPEAKASFWREGDDSLLVATSWGEDSLNISGYPRTIRRWARGTALADAEVVFEGPDTDAFMFAAFIGAAGEGSFVAVRATDYYTNEYWLVRPGEEPVQLPLPPHADIAGSFGGKLLLNLKADWAVGEAKFARGDLVAIELSPLMEAQEIAGAELIFHPAEHQAVRQVWTIGETLYLNLFDDLSSRVIALTGDAEAGWQTASLDLGDDVFLRYRGNLPDGSGFLMSREAPLAPEELIAVDAETGAARALYRMAAQFDTAGMTVERFTVRSADGIEVPYRVIGPGEEGARPTLAYGYGGFEVSVTPRYEPLFGKLWMEKGGRYVLTNIRGGGEFGPAWHQAAMLTHRQRAFNDFAAVLRDLVKRGLTTRKQLAIMGRSNGGLLMGVTMTQHPELVHAVVVGGPLIDMTRYQLLPPGASWAAEYGTVDDPKLADTVSGYSPLQQLRRGVRYPVPLIITSKDDDRVLPAHARRFAARLQDLGHEAYYFEDAQGGHYWELAGGPAPGDWRLRATARAVEFTYLARQTGNDVAE